jgi:hypothetical protein
MIQIFAVSKCHVSEKIILFKFPKENSELRKAISSNRLGLAVAGLAC